ncbi:hypothetical protein PQR62_18950 [Herbaspirillum lusitanum]|uniref:Uncharacterized protein n=1 Tax=Herbaspirillum lusitanum TaxID=213312 RepID=A0ABW9ADG8_9BURK
MKTIASFLFAALFVGAMSGCASPAADIAARPQRHLFMVYSNPVEGKEDDFVRWYAGQHIHDLLQINGVVGAQFFKLSQPQYKGGQPHAFRYLVIWEIESTDLAGVFANIQRNLADGSTVRSDTFAPVSGNDTFTPMTAHLSKDDVKGKSPAQVLEMSGIK